MKMKGKTMTISIQTTTKSNVTVFHHTQDGVKGYMFTIPGSAQQFVDEQDADRLARYMLFEEPHVDNTLPEPEVQPEVDPVPTQLPA